MPKLDDPIAEISARITVLEFVLEVMLANDLAAMDLSTSSDFKREIVSRMGGAYGPIAGNAETARKWQEVTNRAEHIAAKLIEKVGRRESEIRTLLSRGR
jgi:hypothetical protein